MRRAALSTALCVLALALFSPTSPRAGDEGAVIVIPTRPGIPIVINGVDASYAVVEGDWGLARPGAVPVTVIGGAPLMPNEYYARRRPYHPRAGRAPARGRNEIEPPADRPLPDPAESYSRSWSTSSDIQMASDPATGHQRSRNSAGDGVPATITDPQTFPQDFNPPVIVVPRHRRP